METKHKIFKPFDKVLTRQHYGYKWSVDLYSYYDNENDCHETLCEIIRYDENILPYEGNEHLVGTTDEPDEEVKLEEGEWVIGITSDDDSKPYLNSPFLVEKVKSLTLIGNTEKFDFDMYTRMYAVRFSDFNPNDMEETKKHILCVKNGKIVRYKG